MRSPTDTAITELDLLGWKRGVFALYGRVRELEPEPAWREWRAGRDRLFATHPQTPLGADARAGFDALRFFPYDPAFRVTGTVVATEPVVREIDSSTGERIRFRQFGRVEFELSGEQSLPLYWLEGYGGGVFLPFADLTSGRDSYGGGRYLLDSVKGADLGGRTGDWCSTSTSPTTRHAPTTRAGRARCRPGRAGSGSPSRRASTPSRRDRWRRLRRFQAPIGAGYRGQRHVHC